MTSPREGKPRREAFWKYRALGDGHIQSWILELRNATVTLKQGALGEETTTEERTLANDEEALTLCESWCAEREQAGFVQTHKQWLDHQRNFSEESFIVPPWFEGAPPPTAIPSHSSFLQGLGLPAEKIQFMQHRQSLQNALLAGDLDSVRASLDGGLDPNEVDDPVRGHTPLAMALAAGQLKVAQLLASRGGLAKPQLDSVELLHQQLLEAIEAGDVKRVEERIAGGADVQARPHDSESPIEMACDVGSGEILQLLLDAGADPAQTFEPPLVGPALDGRPDLCRILLKAGAEVDRRDEDGDTALMFAAQKGHLDVVEVLLEHGARPEASASSPAQVARECDHPEVANRLSGASS